MVDLLVIGAGLTGLLAAVVAAREGMRTRLIATGLGSMLWSPGTIGVLGYLPQRYRDPVRSPWDALPKLLQTRPQHPYALVDPDILRDYLITFQELTAALGLIYSGEENWRNLLLPSALGAARPVFLAPEGQIDGRMDREEPYLIVGFEGLRDFYPTLIAENLRKLGLSARAVQLPIDLITTRRDFSTVQLAQALDATDLGPLIHALRRVSRSGERIGFPAILGLTRHVAILNELRQALDAPIFEIPTLPPSVPGMRLVRALRHYLERDLQVRIDLGLTVAHAQGEGRSVYEIASYASARPVRHRARRFLLATGGILGGGIHTGPEGGIEETIFRLPLAAIPAHRGRWFHRDFLSPDGQPISLAGVSVNQNFQPLDENGHVVYDNVWAAGNLLAFSDAIAERSREGIAIVTALAAIARMKEA